MLGGDIPSWGDWHVPASQPVLLDQCLPKQLDGKSFFTMAANLTSSLEDMVLTALSSWGPKPITTAVSLAKSGLLQRGPPWLGLSCFSQPFTTK